MATDVQHASEPESTTVEFHTPRLGKERLEGLEQAIDLLVTHGVSMRETLDTNLDIWQNMYDQRVAPKAFPWVGSANYFVPITPTNVDTVTSRLMQLVVPARLFVVKGGNPQAEQQSHFVEKWYNKKLIQNDWQNAVYHYVHLALKDGTCIMEVTWLKKVHSMNLVMDEPVVDPDTGMPVIDPTTGEPLTKSAIKRTEIVEYNDVNWEPVELRDFYLFPAWSRSIEEAPTVGRVLYLSQAELLSMVAAKTLNAKAVEYVLKTVGSQTELPEDEHTESYTAGGQIDVSTPSWTDLTKNQQGSYYKVWRLSTREFDLDGDGVYEENIVFYHEKTKRILGYQHYKYAHGRRMYVPFSPLERPKRFYGYAVPERLYGTQIEANAIRNQRRDEIDLRLSPPLLRSAGATPENRQKQWGPGTVWDVGSVQDVQLMQLPDVPASSWNEEQLLHSAAEKLLGLSDQMLGANVGGRRTKYEMQLMSASISVRMALMASRLQRALQAIFWQTHQLELQYAPENTQQDGETELTEETPMPKTLLRQDYELGINGMGAPLDRQARRQELLFLYNMMLQNPLVSSMMTRVFALTRRVLEEFEIEDTISIIGDEQQAQQLQQAIQQARAQQPPGGAGQRQPNRRQRRQAAQMPGMA